MDLIQKPSDNLIKLRELYFQKAVLQSKDSFLHFIAMFAPTLVPDWLMGRHIHVIADRLQKVESGEIKRLMVFLPPRSSKSVICSKLFPAWYVGRHPQHEILTVSHSDQLASDFGRSVRDLVNYDLFNTVFPQVELRSDVRAAGKWKTNQGGTYYAAGVRSQIAGRGAHVAILDDVMSEEDSFSETGRRYVKEWYPSGLRTRIMPNGSIVIINTRYHEDDLCGWLLRQESQVELENKWEVIKIPAWVDEPSSKLLNLPVGSSYFPEWKPSEILKNDEEEIKASNGSRYWESLYMQNPVPDTGGIIKKKWIQWWDYDEPPACDYIIQTYDTAFSTKTTADFSVIQTWGIFEHMETDSTGRENWVSNLILLGNEKGRFDYPALRTKAQELYDYHKPDVCIIEKKASGQSLIQDLRRAGLPVLDYIPDRDKTARVYAATPMMEAGRVWLPKGHEWSDDLYGEAITFPNARHDDQVDAMTMAIHYMKESWNLTHPDDPDYEEGYERKKRVAYWKF
jgi:predicted phage terminase large subunit-like protein